MLFRAVRGINEKFLPKGSEESWNSKKGGIQIFISSFMLFMFVLSHQLDTTCSQSPEKGTVVEESDQVGLWVCLCGGVLIASWCRKAQPPVGVTIHRAGNSGLYVKTCLDGSVSDPGSSNFTTVCFKFLFKFLPWHLSLMDM